MLRVLMGGVGLMVASVASLGQSDGRFIIMVSGGATPSSPEVTVEVWAAWDEMNLGDFIFAGANYDLVAGDGEFTSAGLLLGGNPPNFPGTLNGHGRVRAVPIRVNSCAFVDNREGHSRTGGSQA